MPGVVICEATNSEGRTEARANVVVNNLDGELKIFEKNQMPIVVGDDNVSVICEGSAHKYTEMDWYKGDDLVRNTMSMCCVH